MLIEPNIIFITSYQESTSNVSIIIIILHYSIALFKRKLLSSDFNQRLVISCDSSTGSALNEAHHEQIDHVVESSELDESNAKKTRGYIFDTTTITTVTKTSKSYQPSSVQYQKLTISEVDELIGMNSADEASAIIRECLALRSKWQSEHPLAPQDIIIPVVNEQDTIDYDQAPTYDVFNTSPPSSTIISPPMDDDDVRHNGDQQHQKLMSFKMVEGIMSIIVVDTSEATAEKQSFHVMSYVDFVHDYNKVFIYLILFHLRYSHRRFYRYKL